MNDQGFSFSPCHIKNYTGKALTASLCVWENLSDDILSKNLHFILASFTLNFCLLERSLITAGTQSKEHFRNSKQMVRAVTIIDQVLFFLCPSMPASGGQGTSFRLFRAGAGKKNFELQFNLHELLHLEPLQCHSLTWQQWHVTDSQTRQSAEMVCCLSECRMPFCSAGTNNLSHEQWCGQGDPSLLLSLGTWKTLGIQQL